MDIQFNETTVQTCQDLARLSKAAQLAMESVVPDTKDDIGRILSVRPEIYLKSKELRNRGALIGGEAVVTVLYINENESAVSSFSLSQSFSQEYEMAAADDGDLLQVRLSVSGLQARVLNPRKVSVDLEICSELTVSRSTDFVVSQALPNDLWTPIHVQRAESSAIFYTGVSEKSFSLNEQLQFPEHDLKPKEIIGKEICYCIRDRETVGTRLLIKGDAQMTLHFFPEDSDLPCSRQFQMPFSQLIDLGENEAEEAEVWIEPTSDYVNLMDSIDGRKLLDVELHALAQARSRRRQKIEYISDAYSNQMPCECSFCEQTITESISEQQLYLSADESIEVPEEFQELLACYPTLGQCSSNQGNIVVDLLCRAKDGKLFSMRRNIILTSGTESGEMTNVSFRVTDFDVRQSGGFFIVRVRAEGEGLEQHQTQVRRISTLQLNAEKAFDSAAYPALTAVWAETESVWELAKLYHSSPEAICALNEDLSRQPVFIPKAK